MTDHEALFGWFTEEAKVCAGNTLRSVTVYGSSVTEDFHPGTSDYNFVVVVDRVGTELLERCGARVPQWKKKRIATPLLLEPSFFEEALDSYPLEFLSMQAHHRVLAGKDYLKDLAFVHADLRLQCERELRAKLLLFAVPFWKRGPLRPASSFSGGCSFPIHRSFPREPDGDLPWHALSQRWSVDSHR